MRSYFLRQQAYGIEWCARYSIPLINERFSHITSSVYLIGSCVATLCIEAIDLLLWTVWPGVILDAFSYDSSISLDHAHQNRTPSNSSDSRSAPIPCSTLLLYGKTRLFFSLLSEATDVGVYVDPLIRAAKKKKKICTALTEVIFSSFIMDLLADTRGKSLSELNRCSSEHTQHVKERNESSDRKETSRKSEQ